MPKQKKKRPPQRPNPQAKSPAQKAKQSRLLLIAAIVIVFAVVAVIIGVMTSGGDDDVSTDDTDPNALDVSCDTDRRMDTYSEGKVVHTDAPGYEGPLTPKESPRYTVNPPSGGDHLSKSRQPGVFEDDGVPPDGELVHSLEHGYVIVWFKPDISNEDKQTLRDVFQEIRRDTLLVERVDMPGPVAATAWGRRLLCNGVDRDRLTEFIKDSRNKAPEKIPH